ncbi:MAG: F0F1 ATP synthase subunit delta, partial [Myxococcota bacterium]
AISEAFRALVDEKMNRATGTIRTAAELDEATQEQLKRALEKRTGKQLDLDVVIDPSLIGGVRAEVGTLVFDGTIKSELEKLRETLRPV